MRRTLFLALLLAGYQTAAPPDTEIFLASFAAGANPVGRPANITNNPGYDNQPSFTPDGAGIFFTSIRGPSHAAIMHVTKSPEPSTEKPVQRSQGEMKYALAM